MHASCLHRVALIPRRRHYCISCLLDTGPEKARISQQLGDFSPIFSSKILYKYEEIHDFLSNYGIIPSKKKKIIKINLELKWEIEFFCECSTIMSKFVSKECSFGHLKIKKKVNFRTIKITNLQ